MSDFKTAFLITIDDAHEGGYQCLHNDSGNWTGGAIGIGELKGTKYGISGHEYPTLDIQNLTTDQAAAIYLEGYWKPLYSQIKDQFLANKIFDMGVLFGVGTAIEILQFSLGVAANKIFGPETLEVLNSAEPVSTLTYYKANMVQHVVNIIAAKPQDRPFFADWVRRINS